MITRCAIRIIEKKERIYKGRKNERHSDLLKRVMITKSFIFSLDSYLLGFIDENGIFYNRQEAAKHAFNCGQINDSDITVLISEDLW
jgi:hypothetical protein